jgi:Fur family peroxide stress response transcriptional regulator
MAKNIRRQTKQLDLIWNEISHDTSHPTADQIYERVKKKIPNISLGTVYRNLQKLEAEGQLQVLTLDRTQHFDPLVDRHHHFICKSCWRVYDVFADGEQEARPSCPSPKGFTVTSRQSSWYGTCQSCS